MNIKKLVSLLVIGLMLLSFVPVVKATISGYPYSVTVSKTVALSSVQPVKFWLGPSVFVNSKGDIIMATHPDKSSINVQIATLDMLTGNTTKIADIGYSSQPGIYSSPDGKTLYILTWDNTNSVPALTCFNLENEKVIWQKSLDIFSRSGIKSTNMPYDAIIPLSEGIVIGVKAYANGTGCLAMYNANDGSLRWKVTINNTNGIVTYSSIYPLLASNSQHIYAIEDFYALSLADHTTKRNLCFLDIDTATGNILKSTDFKSYKDILSNDNSKIPDSTRPIIYTTHYNWDEAKNQSQQILCWVNFDDGLEYPIETLPLGYYFNSDPAWNCYVTDPLYYQIGNIFFAMDNSRTFQDQSLIAYGPTFLWRIDANKVIDPKGNVVPADLRYTFKDNAFYYVNKNILNAVDIKTGNPILNVDLGSDVLNGGVVGFGSNTVYAMVTKTDGKVYLYEITTAINTFTLTATSDANGVITPAGTITVNYGASQTFTITPNTGYKIKDVKVDGASVGAVSTYTFSNITDNHTIEATFEKNQIVIILQVGQTTFTVNGSPNSLDSPPIIKNGRTLLPIRPIVEALGGTVGWDGNERKVTISIASTTIELWIAKNTARVNGTNTPIDSTNSKVVPEVINGRTMLPLRFVTENFGCELQWDPNTQTITITYQG
jgi:hypothetical protein